MTMQVTLQHPVNSDFSCSVDHAKRILAKPNNGGGWSPKTKKDEKLVGWKTEKEETQEHGIGTISNKGNPKKSAEKSTKKTSN